MILVLSTLSLAILAGDSRLYNEDMGKRMNEQIKANNVMSITAYSFGYVNGVLGKESYKSSVEMFDRSGNRTEDAVYLPDGESEFSFIYAYNEEGIQLKSVGISRHKPVYNFWSYEIIDSLGALKKYHSDTRNREYWLSMYDEKGRKIREEYYNADGYVDQSKVFVYDITGKITEKKQYDGYGNLYSRIVYRYDEQGNNSEIIQYASDDVIFGSTLLSYDEKGNVKTSTTRDHLGNNVAMTVYSYTYF